MNDISTKRKFLVLLIVIAYSANLSLYLLSPKALSNDGLNDMAENVILLDNIKSSNNDTTAPVIIFIRPDINDTTIKTTYYEFMVNITDANPPLPGKVSIEIANASTSFFNASMLYDQGTIWFFPWENLTSYPNERIYLIRVRATDSSLIGNEGLSNDIFVNLNFQNVRLPSLLNAIIYIIAVIVIIALVMVYVNKKRSILKTIKD
ncbi:MAG: hypothetical protein ACXAC5_19360 [Promethearchaeota archaeon]